MRLELRRVLCSQTMLFLLLVCLVGNSALFAYMQRQDAYGFSDYTLGSYSLFYGEVEPKAYLSAYTELLAQYQDDPAALSERQSLYSQFETICMLFQISDAEALTDSEYGTLWDAYLKQYPDFETRLESDLDAFRQEVYIDAVAAGKLLDQVTYLQEYDDYLDSIQESAAQMLTFSIFNTGFTARSILKTAEDFAALDGVTLSLSNTLPIHAIVNYRYADFFLFVLLLLTAFQLLQERTNRIWPVVHAAYGGRMILALKRCGVLASCAAVFTVLLYGSTFLEAMLLYRADWSVLHIAAQSVEALQQFPVACTVLGLLIRLLLMRFASAFVLVLLLWLLFSVLPQGKLMIAVAAAILAAEYCLYTFLPNNSAWNLLKYGNLFCLVFSSENFCTYFNLNFFGYPVDLPTFSVGLCAAAGLPAIAFCIFTQWKKRPYHSRSISQKPADWIHRCSDRVSAHFGPFWFSLYQSLILRHGWVVFLLFFLYCTQAQFAVQIPNTEENGYYAQLEGPIGSETYDTLHALIQENTEDIAKADALQEQWENGLLTFQAYFSGMTQYGSSYTTGEILEDVQLRVDELASENLWILDSTDFDAVYGSETSRLQAARALLLLLAFTLLFSGTLTTERQSQMYSLTRSTIRGRSRILSAQYAAAAVEMVVLCLIPTVFELCSLAGLGYLSAPVQSIAWLQDFPISCSVRGFLSMHYIYRFAVCISIGFLLIWFSGLFRSLSLAEVLAGFLILVPSALALYFDLTIFRPFSAALPVLDLHWMWDGKFVYPAAVGMGLLLAAAAGMLWTFLRRKRSWS